MVIDTLFFLVSQLCLTNHGIAGGGAMTPLCVNVSVCLCTVCMRLSACVSVCVHAGVLGGERDGVG